MGLINTIDNSIYNLISSLINPNITAIMIFISFLGSATTLIILSIGFICLFKSKKDSKFVILNLILVFLLNKILKLIVARPRPNILRFVEESRI